MNHVDNVQTELKRQVLEKTNSRYIERYVHDINMFKV